MSISGASRSLSSRKTTATRRAATVGAALLVCSVQVAGAQEPRPEPPPARDIPERYSRQVAPTPSTYWRAPDLRDYTRVLKSAEAPLIDPNKRYGLPELIDLAQRVNPETRVAWEAARRSALAVGLVESEYFPALAISALGGYQSVGVPIPKNLVSDGFFRFDLAQAVPTLNLRWLLLDFGRRGTARDAAKERLLAANLGFNRKHQQIAFAVQRAFYGLTSVRARIAVAQSSLDAARAVQEATESRLRGGLATRPELAPPTGRPWRWSAMSARSWAARGSPPTANPPGGSERPNRAMASGSRSSGSSSMADRASAGSSWPNRRVGPPTMRSRRRATAPSAKCGR